jgi:hypothetical protein
MTVVSVPALAADKPARHVPIKAPLAPLSMSAPNSPWSLNNSVGLRSLLPMIASMALRQGWRPISEHLIYNYRK